jgi:hypothetical protein
MKIETHKTLIFLTLFYGCQIWSVTLADERGLRLSQNMVLRKMFRPKRDEVTGEWRRIQREELYDL